MQGPPSAVLFNIYSVPAMSTSTLPDVLRVNPFFERHAVPPVRRASVRDWQQFVGLARRLLIEEGVKDFSGADVVSLAAMIAAREQSMLGNK